MPRLKTFANLWTLWDHPAPGTSEWSLEQKVAAIAAAGFDGVMGDPGQGIGALAARHRLVFIAFLRLDETHDFRDALDSARREGAQCAQVHLGWHDTPAELALQLALDLDRTASDLGLETVIETHRDTCTDTPEKTLALQEGFARHREGRRLPLLLDLSHPAVFKHLMPPFAPRLLSDRDSIRHARWHHLRPFNGHHAQIPVFGGDGLLTPEARDWADLALDILAVVHESPHQEVWVCPELGPLRSGYGLSCFPPSWPQAVALRQWLVERWGDGCPSPNPTS